MRKLGIAVLIIVVLFVTAALIVPHVIDINHYRGEIQAQLQKRLGRAVTLGEMSLGLFPPSFQVNNAVIAEDPRVNSSQAFAKVEKLAVSVDLLPLLQKHVKISSLELDRPHIELIRDAQGAWNFATLGQEANQPQETTSQQAKPQETKPGQTGTPQPEPQQEARPAGQLTLSNLQIVDGQVAVTDLQKHQSRAVYDHIDLKVADFAPDQRFSLKVTAHLPGSGKQAIYLQGKGGPIQRADMMNTPFDGELKMDQVSISAAEKFLNSQGLQGIDALVSGDATVKKTAAKVASSGKIKFEDPRIHKVDVGYPITLDYDLSDDLTSDVIQITKGNIKLGATPITVAGTLNTRPNPAQLDMKVTAANASIVEMARLASAFGVAFDPGASVKGTVNADLQARGPANKPVMNGQISAKNLDISGKDIPQPVHVNDIELALTPDTIRSNDFAATTGSTSVNANFTLSNYSGNNSSINAGVRAPNARLGEILNIAKAAGVSAVKGVSGDGTVSFNLHAQGPTKKMAALDLSGTGKISNASLKLPTLNQPLQVRNSDIQLSTNSVVLQNFSASLGQATANGALTLKNFAAPVVQFTLNAGGPVGEILDLAKTAGVTAVKDISGDGTLNLAVKGNGPIKNMSALDLSGTGKISNANLKMPSLSKPLQLRNSDIQFNRNTVVLQNVSAALGQATADGALTLKNFEAPVVQFTLNAGGPVGEILELAKTAGVSAVKDMTGDGTLSLAVKGSGPIKNTSAMDLTGTGKISNANLKMPSLTKPLQVRNSDIQLSKNSIALQNINAGIGSTNASGTMSLRNFEAPQVQFTLNLDKVNVTELQQIFNAAPAQPKRAALQHDFWSMTPKAEAQAPANNNPQPSANNPQPSVLTTMTGGGTVTIGTVQYDDLLLNNTHANITLDHGLIKMNPVTAGIYGGTENGAITIDMRQAQPVYTVNLKTDKVDANKLVSSVSDLKQTIYGMLASNINAQFSSSSASGIARSLNGSMAINLTNGKLMNINLLHELASVGKFLGGNFDAAKNFTDLAQLTGNFDVKNGVAQTNNLNAAIDGGTLAATGLVNLADQTLNLHVTTVLNKALSQQVGGTQVGGYMNTALANNEGELVMPVIITGTFQHPHVAPDVQQMAQMRLKNMLPNTKNPAELTTGILGAVLGGKNQSGAAGQPANGQQKGGIGGILDAIGGKPQQPNQQGQPQQQQNPAVGNNEGQPQQPNQQQQQQQQQNPAVGNNEGQPQQPNQQQQQSTPAASTNQGQEQLPQQDQPQQQASPAAGTEQAQQPAATATPTPGWGDVLNQVLNRKKKEQATPSPTPTPP